MRVKAEPSVEAHARSTEVGQWRARDQATLALQGNRAAKSALGELQHAAGHGPQARRVQAWQDQVNQGPRAARAAQCQVLADGASRGGRLSLLAERPAVAPVMQARKTVPFNLPKRLAARFDVQYSEYKDLGVPAYQALVYDKLQAAYDASLTKGQDYWSKLETALAAYRGDGREGWVAALEAKRRDYDARFAANYITKTKPVEGSHRKEVHSSGLAADGDAVDPTKDVPYSNSVDLGDNSITAEHNYAERDMARQADVEHCEAEGYEADVEDCETGGYETRGLPNSEILWQQYKQVAREQYWLSKDTRSRAFMAKLSAVKRSKVQNVATLRTVMFALPDGLDDLQMGHTWAAGSEEFLALLGTPNCSGVAFMLADHVDEVDGKSITEIRLLGGDDVNLDIKLG